MLHSEGQGQKMCATRKGCFRIELFERFRQNPDITLDASWAAIIVEMIKGYIDQ